MKITQDTLLKDLFSIKAFTGFRDILFFIGYNGGAIRDLNRHAPYWLTGDIADSFQYLLDTGARYTRLYDENERRADTALKKAILFEFSLEGPAPSAVLRAGGAYASVASMVEAFPSARRFNALDILHLRCNIAWERTVAGKSRWTAWRGRWAAYWKMRNGWA